MLIVFPAARVSVITSIRPLALSVGHIEETSFYLDLSDEEVSSAERKVTTLTRRLGLAISIACFDTAIYLSAMVSWHWLLPPIQRTPENFEPAFCDNGGKRGILWMVAGGAHRMSSMSSR